MTKSELRKIYKNQRNLLSTLEIQDFSQKIFENLKKMPIWNKSYYHVFVPIKSQNEINTHLIIDYLFDLNKSVVVPKVNGSQMINCKIDENVEWVKGRFDVPEPKDFEIIENELIEVVFVPMLICDQSGNRVGYGGGFYDRFFQEIGKDVLIIGINYFSPIESIEDVEPTDISLDYCVTSREIVSFTS